MPAAASAPPAALSYAAPPSVWRRLAALLYECVLLFGLVFLAGLAFALALQQRNGLTYHHLLTAWIALVVGAYFVWSWTHGGQTLAMKTWRLRIESARGMPLSVPHAIARYVLAWLWFVPPLALHPLAGFSLPHTLALTAVWIVLWACAARLHPTRQFLHDRLAGTRIVSAAPAGHSEDGPAAMRNKNVP